MYWVFNGVGDENMEIKKKNHLEGYFTLEATLLFPIVLGAVFLALFLLFFYHDKCMMDLDEAYVVVIGASWPGERSDVKTKMEALTKKNVGVRNLWMKYRQIDLVVKEDTLSICIQAGFDFWIQKMDVERSFQVQRYKPVFWIRSIYGIADYFNKEGGN